MYIPNQTFDSIRLRDIIKICKSNYIKDIHTFSGRGRRERDSAKRETETRVKRVLGTKVNNMASLVKGLVCLWHHEHGRTYTSHDFSGGGRSRVLVSWRSTREATSRRWVPWLATPCYLLSFPINLKQIVNESLLFTQATLKTRQQMILKLLHHFFFKYPFRSHIIFPKPHLWTYKLMRKPTWKFAFAVVQ